MKDTVCLGDYVVVIKLKNKEEKRHYYRKIFRVYKYDNKTRLYQIEQVWPTRIRHPYMRLKPDDPTPMDSTDKYNKWDSGRLKKLKLGQYLYG